MINTNCEICSFKESTDQCSSRPPSLSVSFIFQRAINYCKQKEAIAWMGHRTATCLKELGQLPICIGQHRYSLRTCTRPRALVWLCLPPRALPGGTGQLTGARGQNMGCSARELEWAGGKPRKGRRLCPVWPQTWETTQNHLCPPGPQRVTSGSWFLKWSLRNPARQQRAILSGDVLSS